MKNILKPTKIIVICNIFLTLFWVVLIIFLPASGVSDAFGSLTLAQKLLSFVVSYIISFILYYPLTASLVYLVRSIKNSSYVFKEIILAVILIAIFNPLTFSVIITKLSFWFVLPTINQSKEIPVSDIQNSNQPTCGLKVTDFTANSKAEEAGINKGDNILSLNGAQINSVKDVFNQLENKKPGEKVTLETDQGLKTIELVPSTSDPNKSALGVMLITNQCK